MKNKSSLNKSQSNFHMMKNTRIYESKLPKMQTLIHDNFLNNVIGRKRLSKTTTKYSIMVPVESILNFKTRE
jgi:hypothetical protein